jgi:hypothetical protein
MGVKGIFSDNKMQVPSIRLNKYIWDVPFEIRHGLRLMVPDFLEIFFCYTLTIGMNNVVLDFSKKKIFDCFKIILKMTKTAMKMYTFFI